MIEEAVIPPLPSSAILEVIFLIPWGNVDLTIASISFPIGNDSITKHDYLLVLIK